MPLLSDRATSGTGRRRAPRRYGLLASAVVLLTVILAIGLSDAWSYYTTPLRVRAYAPGHRWLRPSGAVGQALGVVGLLMMTMPILYAARKKWKRLARAGDMNTWLEAHIFCGVVGPVLITLHTSFKFNGLVSVAYWSMIAVMLSGFVGRYLYVRMPRSIRGVELSYEEIQGEAARVRTELEASGLPAPILEELASLEDRMLQSAHQGASVSWLAPVVYRWRLRRLALRMGEASVPAALVSESTRLARERVQLLRRLTYLERTRRLFALWHVFHQPLVYLMFTIAVLHVALAAYLGYVPFLRW